MNQKSIQIKFVGHEIQKGVVMYKIQLYDTRDSTQWVMQHRYSIMREIHNQLKEQNPDKIPEFPPKKWFGNMDEKFINQREKSLENYFSNCLKALSIDKSKTLKQFLLQKKSPGPIMQDDQSAPPSQAVSMIQGNPQQGQQNRGNNNNNNNNNNAPQPRVVNPQEEQKQQMEKIVSTVPFIDFVPFVSPEHNNQDYKRNVYNQITFQSKSKLLQNFQLPSSTTDFSEQAKQAQPVNVQFGRKMDSFAEKINASLGSYLSNIQCNIISKPQFA